MMIVAARNQMMIVALMIVALNQMMIVALS